MNSHTRRFAFLALAIGTLLVNVSCSSNGQKETSDSGTKAPEMDIHTAIVADSLHILKQHIAAGTDINQKDPFGGSSPLISATVFDKPEAARLLLDAGADVNFQNNDGSTALHTAAFFCRPEMVKMLLEKGADKSIKNKYNATAYETVSIPFDQAKGSYELMEKLLGPMGLKMDYSYIEKTRPEVADMLK